MTGFLLVPCAWPYDARCVVLVCRRPYVQLSSHRWWRTIKASLTSHAASFTGENFFRENDFPDRAAVLSPVNVMNCKVHAFPAGKLLCLSVNTGSHQKTVFPTKKVSLPTRHRLYRQFHIQPTVKRFYRQLSRVPNGKLSVTPEQLLAKYFQGRMVVLTLSFSRLWEVNGRNTWLRGRRIPY